MSSSLTETKNLVQQLFEEAAGEVQLVKSYDGADNLEAQMVKKALELTIERSATIRSVQMQIIAEAARKQLWLSHPPTEDYPQGYGELNDLLTDAGFKGSTKSYLLAVGEDIVPFCDQYSIPIDEYMTNSLRPKFEYAIAALKAGIVEDDPKGVEMVLHDVVTFPSRESISMKYHEPRTRQGRGTTVKLKDGRTLLVMVLNNDGAVEPVLRKVAGVVEWGLPAQAWVKGQMIEAEIYDGYTD